MFSLKDIRGSDARCQDVISFLFAGSRVSTVFFFHAGFYFRRIYNWMWSFIEIYEFMVLLVAFFKMIEESLLSYLQNVLK